MSGRTAGINEDEFIVSDLQSLDYFFPLPPRRPPLLPSTLRYPPLCRTMR